MSLYTGDAIKKAISNRKMTDLKNRSLFDKNKCIRMNKGETSSQLDLIDATKKWFETIVIGPQKLCPFAPYLRHDDNLLRIVKSEATTIPEAIADLEYEVMELVGNSSDENDENDEHENHSHHETTLVVFDDKRFEEVREFRSFVRLSWNMQLEAIVEKGFGNDLQLVLFHPKATHDTYTEYNCPSEDLEKDMMHFSFHTTDAADYTIRSPFPTVHLLREKDVMRAVKSGYPNLESLPARNKAKLRDLGLIKCDLMLQQCYTSNQYNDAAT